MASDSKRVDLTAPPFSHPTKVTNPLFPISVLRSAVLSGRIDGKPFHTETTLLPYTRVIEWLPGHRVETLISQYTAFLNGRLQEVALDYYAQADDGSVWYFGEDVIDYDEGRPHCLTTELNKRTAFSMLLAPGIGGRCRRQPRGSRPPGRATPRQARYRRGCSLR